MNTDNITNIIVDLGRLAANIRRAELELEAQFSANNISTPVFEASLKVLRRVAHEMVRGASVGAIDDDEWENFLKQCTVRGHHRLASAAEARTYN